MSVSFQPIFKVVVGLFVIAGFAARAFGAETWTQVTTKNFFLIGDAPESEIKLTAMKLEQFRETLRSLFPQIKVDGVRTNVVVFKNAASYSHYRPKRPDGTADDGVAGYFQKGEDVNYITLSTGEKPGTYGTVFHEYVHFLLDTNIGRSDLPPWLNEGLAEYFETLKIGEDGQVIIGIPQAGHMKLLKQNDLIPLKAFFETDNSALHRSGDESRSLFYAQAWLIAHYLLHNSTVGSSEVLDKLLAVMRKSDMRQNEFVSLFPVQTGLETALKTYRDQQAVPTRTLQFPEKLEATAVISAPLTEAGSVAYLGDLLYHTGRYDEAELQLKRALKLDSDSSVANMSFGLVLAQKKKFAGARKHLEKAIAADRTNHFAYFNFAYAVSRESSDEYGNVFQFPPEAAAKMSEALSRAIALKPDFAESYHLLAFINMVNGTDLDAAAELLKKGLALRPGDQEIELSLAEVYLQQEKYLDAKTVAGRIAKTAADDNLWTRSQSIISTVNHYFAAKAAGTVDKDHATVFGPLPPLIIKRSTLTDADVARYEQERMISNLNLMIARPRFAQKQIVGYVDRIKCHGGNISYTINSGGETFGLASENFTDVRLGVLTEGERSFTIDCGVSLGKQLAVITFEPSVGSRPNIRGRLLSIAFVPDYFRRKTPEEMAARRTVIIEDDRVFRSRSQAGAAPPSLSQ